MVEIDPAYTPAALEQKDVFGVTFEQGHNDFRIDERLLGNIVTENRDLPESASEAEIEEAVAAFMADIGADNRLFYSDAVADPRVRRAMYVASRKNFDRLVAEGKAVL